MIKEYERDVIIAQGMHHEEQSDENREMCKIRKAADLVSRFRLSKARQFLQSNGLAKHDDPRIVQQLSRKHPNRKEDMTPLTQTELNVQRKGISKEVLTRETLSLKHDVAPGIGCLRNEHLIAIILNPKQQVTPMAATVMDNFYEYANAIVEMQLPEYFYTMWVAGRMVLLPTLLFRKPPSPNGTRVKDLKAVVGRRM